MSELQHALFVAWQNPATHRFVPVARLASLITDDGSSLFEFAYINHATGNHEFQPFLSFPRLEHVYRSRDLFPMFQNRLMSPRRSDYGQHMEQLGLSLHVRDPLIILSRSGGRRMTDTLELFPMPEFEPEYGYRTWFWAHGMRQISADAHQRLLQLQVNEQVFPHCDQGNPVQPDAIELRMEDGGRIGYLPTYLLDDAWTLHETCSRCEIFVDRINPPPAVLHQRLLLRLESCWPDGFTPYASSGYQPISADAARLTDRIVSAQE